MSSLDYLDLCRLCLVKDRVSVPIFDGEGDVRQIFLKIAACLPVKVAREDKLPKKICDDCVYKVELFYQFWNTTVNAEKQLLQWLGEVGMEGKQGYVTNVLNPNVMKQEQSTENRLDGSVMQQVSEHQNNMGIGMMDNIGLGIPMIISNTNQQQQITSVPMDTSSNSAQNVQAVPGPSSQTTHNQISQNQTSSTQQEEEEESSEDEENSDDECDGDEGLPVKEESEEDPNSRTIEPTTFVNVSLACDEAGPSGLQQQKIADMPEIPMPQTADGDPKSGIPTIADTSTVQNPAHPLFIECNGSSVSDQDDIPIQIKPAPISHEDEDSIDSLMTDGSYCSAIEIVKEEPYLETVPAVLVPVRDPVTRNIQSMYVPVEVKDETGLNIIKSVLIPIKDNDGPVSYEIKKVVVPINLPPKTSKLPTKDTDKSKSKKIEKGDDKRRKQKVKKSQKKKEGSQKIAATDASKEVDEILQNLRTVCPLCQRKFKSEKQMGKHISRDHKRPFRCRKCYESYDSQGALDAHLKSHQKDTRLECPFCHLKYKRMSGLRIHQIRVHSSVDPKTIRDRNNESFVVSADLREQKPHPLWMKTFSCEFCNKVYPRQAYLVAHQRIVHGIQKKEPKLYPCDVCHRNFVTESNLRNHATSHSQSFLCAECGKVLANRYSLQLHTRKHTGERPYECQICSKSFTSSVALRVHRVTHTGEKPYECDLCGQRFTQRSSMITHRRKHPGNRPPPPPLILSKRENDGN
ncbi:myoneurin-like isoform X10 [Colletes gigas]|uniref:myoneurin-like isoform X10 n=1 Tax=Colletes gigas TaxID=935657 RepID=UPI001C9B7E8A|nr:myoneurin-like isoform X10 [Colletes gigas]